MSLRSVARYQCRSCRVTFEGPAGPVVCISCGHEYLNWLNYSAIVEGRDKRTVNVPDRKD